MPASAFTPDITVELAFDSGFSTLAASRTWTDVSAYVEAQSLVQITRGRQDESSDVSPSQLTLTLDNRDGRFTPEYSSGAYFPNVKLGRPIRVRATWNGVTYDRFLGYVTEWPVSWPDATSGSSVVTVRASSRMARLGRNAAFRSVVEQDILQDSPVMYYPLGEPEGSTQASNVSTLPQYPLTIGQTGSGGALTFGAGAGPATDGLTAPVLAPAGSDGKWLGGEIQTSPISAGNALTMECWVVASGSGRGLVHMISSDGAAYMRVGVGGGIITARLVQPTASLPTLAGSADVLTGGVHHVVYRVALDGLGGYAQALLVDGVVDATGSGATGLTSLADVDFLYVGKGSPDAGTTQALDGTIAHVAVYDSALSDGRAAEHYQSGTTGFEGESSDDRVARLAGWAGVDAAEMSLEAGGTESMTFVDTTGASPIAAMQDVARTENGVLFDAGDGTLTFHSRAHRYNAAVSATLSAATQQIEADLEPKVDDFGLLNDVTLTNGTATVRIVDQASIDDRGVYSQSETLLTTSDLELDDAANYRVNAYADPLVRIPSASVLLPVQPSATITAILAVELGDVITLNNLPSQAPASSMDFFVEGYTEVIGSEGQGWLWTANLSPVLETQTVWELGVSQLGVDTKLAY